MGGQCWTKEGQPKLRYSSRATAKQARRDLSARHDGSDPGRPYRCGECEYFHLGHYPSAPAIRRRLRGRHRSEAVQPE